jgi:spore germination cell wall hydrolase CwlJ-like protein
MAFTFILKYDDLIDFTDGATHYHAYYVSPAWAKTKTRTAKIEDHIFYRWENAN